MFDDELLLRDRPALSRLLEHYAQVSSVEPTAWQDRLAELTDVTPKELVQLHGELLAHDWIEQNTGVVVLGKPGVIAACYRITATGRRALCRAAEGDGAELETQEGRSERAA